MEELEARVGASCMAAVHPRAPAAHGTREAGSGAAIIAPSLTQRRRRGALRSGLARLALGALYAVLAALSGVFVDFLEDPPTVITAIVVVTVFGALVANDISRRRRE